jgi:hypothetical protein
MSTEHQNKLINFQQGQQWEKGGEQICCIQLVYVEKLWTELVHTQNLFEYKEDQRPRWCSIPDLSKKTNYTWFLLKSHEHWWPVYARPVGSNMSTSSLESRPEYYVQLIHTCLSLTGEILLQKKICHRVTSANWSWPWNMVIHAQLTISRIESLILQGH